MNHHLHVPIVEGDQNSSKGFADYRNEGPQRSERLYVEGLSRPLAKSREEEKKG